MTIHDSDVNDEPQEKGCVSRRNVLLAGGVASSVFLTGLPWSGWAKTSGYPRKLVGNIKKLQQDEPVDVDYPDEDSPAMLVKLGTAAGGGVGVDNDIVAFSTLCTHMGGPMDGTYNKIHKGLGPCPLHLTTFDLTRHGIMIGGHATESLPQVMLEVEGDAIYAVGVMGLIYGRASNL